MTAFAIVASFVFGTCIGSFLNVVIWRLPREQSLGGWSRCPHCKHQLVWYDLIPLVSWLLQNRQCRYCHKDISPRYPIMELMAGILFAGAAWQVLPFDLVSGIMLLKFFIVIAICIVVFVVDLEHYLILDRVVFPGIILMLLVNVTLDVLMGQSIISLDSITASGILAGVAAFIPFWFLWFISNKTWMGFGDVKFVVFMGLALGLSQIVVGLFAAFIFGAIVGLILILLGKKELGSKLPFGTFLSLTTVLALFWGHKLWAWYWGLFALVV